RVIVMFWFAYALMNRSIDKWFSRPVEEVHADTTAIASLLSNYAAQNARAEAVSIAASPETQRAFSGRGFSTVMSEFRRQEPTLQGGFIFAIENGNAEASFGAPAAWPLLKTKVPIQKLSSGAPVRMTWEQTDYMLGAAAVGDHGLILVAMPLPQKFSETVRQSEVSEKRYLELSRSRKTLRRTYMGMLLLLTVMVLFATTWLALFLSKLVTRSVAPLFLMCSHPTCWKTWNLYCVAPIAWA